MCMNKLPGKIAIVLLLFGFSNLNAGIGAASINRVSIQQPVLKLINSSKTESNLLTNSDFELWNNNVWRKYENGFSIAKGEGRNNSTGIFINNESPGRSSGAAQTLTLNQSEPAPIVVSGWSKAENVSGSPDSGYSLYVDLIYNDGTPLWGQTANFRCGTHDWEKREIVIMPDKPVKTLTLYCLFRGHSGKVWFDDISLFEIKSDGNSFLWQGLPVVINNFAQTVKDEKEFSTKDGLRLLFKNGYAIAQLDNEELAKNLKDVESIKPSGFLVRDAAMNSDIYSINTGWCKDINLELIYNVAAKSNHLEISGTIRNLTTQDRAITLVFALPVEADGWQWWDDIRRSRQIKGKSEFSAVVPVRCGSTGAMSLYPIAAINNERFGLAIGIDMLTPAIYRISYHAGLKQFLIAYDFGLAQETINFPSSANFKFVIYRFSPEWGFRSALQKYIDIFPEYFEVRAKEQGIWMPFTDISAVQNWKDFGFKFHEGNNNVKFDDANGILSFRYTEPMTWWMPMDKNLPRSFETAIRVRDSLLSSKNAGQKTPAQVTLSAGMYDEDEKPAILFINTPWCNGAVWSINPNPYLPDKPNFCDWHWSDEIMEKLYGKNADGSLDGEYLDSLEGYITTDLNYRREHFKHTTVPLVFATDSKRLALFKGLAVFEVTKWVSERMRRMGKLTFANGVPYRFTFLCALLDVMGTETDWNPNGKWNPPPDSRLCLWRSMAGAKPYLLLMNTRYDEFSTNLVEKYFDRSAFYGFFPSMFSHNAAENPYWQNPKWYNRDRELFKKYIPIIKRVAEAGWRPITAAKCDNPSILLERFGDFQSGKIYITAFNPGSTPRAGEITISEKGKNLVSITELISGRKIQIVNASRWTCEVQPERTAIFELTLAH